MEGAHLIAYAIGLFGAVMIVAGLVLLALAAAQHAGVRFLRGRGGEGSQ